MQRETNAKDFEMVVKNTLGEDHKVKRLAPGVTFEIKEIDPTVEREELIEEVAEKIHTNKNYIEIKKKASVTGARRRPLLPYR